MAAPPCSVLQNNLQAAVQSVQWTYSLFWQMCPQQRVLIWGDGYYNGAIKTRKTVQPMEVSAEEASLQRSQQLRELYESLSAGDINQPARRPCAALSPEDLTESEWFYLMCVSFSFAPGVGLPGKAYARRQHVWLTGATESDSKIFSRAILAKSARVQTVVCIPILDGVVEFGTTERVEEDAAFIQHVKSFFMTDPLSSANHPPPPPPPQKPALSEHSTSNPTTSSGQTRFHSLSAAQTYSTADPMPIHAGDEEEDDDEDDDDEDDNDSDSEAEIGRSSPISRPSRLPPVEGVATAVGEPSEVMQLDMSEDIRLGSPEDGSNMESDFNLDGAGRFAADCQRRANVSRAESSHRWDAMQQQQQPPLIENLGADEVPQEDTHYSQTVSAVLQKQSVRWAAEPSSSSSSAAAYLSGSSSHSAFSKWSSRSDHLSHLHHNLPNEGTSQWLLKYILFSVPYLHNKYWEENSPKSRDGDSSSSRLRKGTTAAQDELSANHVLAERRRREKLNERFIILRSLVPFVTKMDKASILGDTIEYVKQLRKKIQDLESRNRQMESEQQHQRSGTEQLQKTGGPSNFKELASPKSGRVSVGPPDRRKMRIIEGSGGTAKAKSMEAVPATAPPPTLPPPPVPQPEVGTSVEVSIIESDALIEMQCGYREGLLLDVMQTLREVRIETTGVLSSMSNNIFVAEIRAKLKDNRNGRKVTIMEVKRAINQIIPQD